MATQTDSQGRLYLPKNVREKYGEKYHVVEYDEKIELIPIAVDPLAAARDAAGELRDASHEEIEDAVADEAEREAGRSSDE